MSEIANKKSLSEKIRNMMNNHIDRPKAMLQLVLVTGEENLVLDREEFPIYAYDHIEKLKEKIDKLKYKGGYVSLSIKELVEKSEGEYYMILSI